MDALAKELVRKSCSQVPWQSVRLTRNFNTHLFNVSLDAQAAYAHGTLTQNARMLSFFGAAAEMLDDPAELGKLLEQVGRRHASHGVTLSYLPAIGEALLRTLESELQQEFTGELRAAWRDFYHQVCALMRANLPSQELQRPASFAHGALRFEELFEESGLRLQHLPLP